MDDILGHGGVDFPSQFDEARVLSILARLPGQIKWIDWNAMAAQARPRIEGHEAEWLRPGSLDHFPDINAHGAIDDLQLIDQSNINSAKLILDQLGRSGHDRKKPALAPSPPAYTGPSPFAG